MIPEDDFYVNRDEPPPKPRGASRAEVNRRLDRIALAISAAHEELSGLRHELGVAERLDVQRRKME